MKLLTALCLVVGAAILIAAVLVYEGVIEIAADVPHSKIVFEILETARRRAIAVRAKDIKVPPLDNLERVSKGARDYADMCTECHLAPGGKDSELSKGLYPQPPDLTRSVKANPAEMFWVIKHGIKMTAMPAWGLTHDDERIWDIVAFIQKLPELTPEQYHKLARDTEHDGPEEQRPEGNGDEAAPTAEHEHHHHQRSARKGRPTTPP